MDARTTGRGWAVYFIGLGVLTTLCIASQTIVVVALFMIVPGLILLAAPSLLAYSLIAAFGVLLGRRWGWLIAAILVVAIGVVPPLLANGPLMERAAALRSGDRPYRAEHSRPATVALLLDTPAWSAGRNGDVLGCHQYCQRLLYGNEAKTVLIGIPKGGTDPLAGVAVDAYRVEHREKCPPPDLPERDSWREIGNRIGGARTDDMIRLRVSAGDCLLRQPARLIDADLIIVEQSVSIDRDQVRPRPALQARRVAAYRRTGRAFMPVYRQTATEIRPLIVPWIYSRDGNWLDTLQFLRRTVKASSYELLDVMRGTLGYKLTLDTVAAAPDQERWPLRALLRRGLANPEAAIDDPDLALTDQYLRAIAEAGPADADDTHTIATIVADKRVGAAQLFYLSRAIRRLGNAGAPLGTPLLDRLMATPMPRGADMIQVMSRGIQALPSGSAKPLYSRLVALSEDDERRDKSWAALTRLADAGTPALDRILAVAGLHEDADGVRGEGAVGGLVALCALGSQGSAATPIVVAALRATPASAMRSSRTELLWIILERQGGAEALLATMTPDDRTRRNIERWRSIARNPNRACSSTWV